jgi:hypothetical protein
MHRTASLRCHPFPSELSRPWPACIAAPRKSRCAGTLRSWTPVWAPANACPKCRGENLEYGTYDSATDRETGYADFGERYHCRDCGATGDVDDTVAVLAMLPPPARRLALAGMPAELSEVAW